MQKNWRQLRQFMPKSSRELEERAARGVISTRLLFHMVSLSSAEENEKSMRVEYDRDGDSLATLSGHKQ